MRQCTLHLMLIASIVIVAFAGPGPAIAAGSSNRNAATWYNRAFDHLEKISDADWEVLWAYEDRTKTPPPDVRAVLAKARPMFELARRGSRQGYCDFDLDYDQGFSLRLPHLALIRRVAKLMHLDALVRLHMGDTAGAAEQVSAMYRMASHCGQDGTVISSLVGHAIFALAEQTAEYGFDRAVFTAGDADSMLRAMRTLSTRDPFAAVEGVIGEQAMSVDWLALTYGEQEQRQGLLEDFDWLDADDPFAGQLQEMTDEDFAAEVEEYDELMNRIVEAFMTPDREAGREEMERIDEEMESQKHGALATLLLPALDKVFDRMTDAEGQVADRIETLEGLATGVIDPEQEANAALFYGRAIEFVQEVDRAKLEALFAFEFEKAASPADPVRVEIAATLESAKDVLELASAGSDRNRCDFAMLRGGDDFALCPEYVAGMWDVLRVLLADARCLFAAEKWDAAAERLAVIYRVIAHLGEDDRMLSARVAHSAFGRTVAITRGCADAGRMTDTHRKMIRSAMRRIARKDPFGYIRAMTVGREHGGGLIYITLAPEGGDGSMLAPILAAVREWDGDQLLFYLGARDFMLRAEADEAPPSVDSNEDTSVEAGRPRSEPLRRLVGVIDMTLLDSVRASVPLVAPALARGEIDIFAADPVPRFAGFDEGKRQARADLRRGLELLRPIDEGPEDGPG